MRFRRIAAVVAALTLMSGAVLPAGAAPTPAAGVHPRASGGVDCNGFSGIQRPARLHWTCADPRIGGRERLEDNGHYIGHDEPNLAFYSNRPGTGNSYHQEIELGKDPSRDPTVAQPGSDVTHHFELSFAPWFSMALCDPNSYPLLPCQPNNDGNAAHGRYPGAGAAFLELQFFPPGFAPFVDSISCDNTHWCSALTVDSLECTSSFVCNNNCFEPINAAFIQRDGVPPGPPSPQLLNLKSLTPNSKTLLMSPGDKIAIDMFDTVVPGGHAVETRVSDLTSGKWGFMTASAANGFMSTNITDCSGTPFNFQPEYRTARPQNTAAWIGLNLSSTFELGHFEPCTRVTGTGSFSLDGFTDTYALHCIGPYEQQHDTPNVGEPDDSPCFTKGDTHGGTAPPNLVTGCYLLGADLDFDGTPYRTDWPDSVTPGRFPGTFLLHQPISGGRLYETIGLRTNIVQFEAGCDPSTPQGCVLPPPGADFYPHWTLARVHDACVWEFGNLRNGNTFGGLSQYGTLAAEGTLRHNPSCED